MTRAPDLFPFLALAARAQSIPAQYEQLRRRAATLTAWDDVPLQANDHGLEPLLYAHLRAAGVAIPAHIESKLQARAMQHAHANHIRAKALAEILRAFQNAAIETLVLKGAALAHLVYPQPSLRVMRDVDILVGESEAERAQTLLAQMGYHAPLTDAMIPHDFKHLPMAQRETDGMLITIEVHRKLFAESPNFRRTQPALVADLESLCQTAVAFVVDGITAYTLGCDEMLTHVYLHLREDAFLRHLRLINWADLVGVAEQYVNQIDWSRIVPEIRFALEMIHPLTPLSQNLIRAAGIRVEQDSSTEWDVEYFWQYPGWPRVAITQQPTARILDTLRQSVYPPRWWLRFYYGLTETQVVFPGQMMLHPLNLLSHFLRVMWGRVEKRLQRRPVQA